MEATQDKDTIGLLNDLVRINNDRIEGYERAIDDTTDTQLKNMFHNMAQESRKYRNELVTEVTKMGGSPVEGTTASGKVFRVWMDFKAALAGKDRKAIVSSCESGEDVVLETYDTVLTSGKLSQQYKSLVDQQRKGLQQSHDKIKTLRDNTKGSTM
jgi:uncharacterized protein (TIGR02284 family)